MKIFTGGVFRGEIMFFNGTHYTIWYSDGDCEYLTEKKLQQVYTYAENIGHM